jgi:NADH:ubiquinone oxidoreductase subunit 2 (subunit N)
MITFLPEHYLIFGILSLLSFFSLTNLSITHNFPRITNGIYILCVLLIINFMLLTVYDLAFGDIFFNFFFMKLELHSFIQLFISVILLLLLSNFFIFNKNQVINVFEFYIVVLLSFFSICLLISSRELISFFFFTRITRI